jgi:hypothetical protein
MYSKFLALPGVGGHRCGGRRAWGAPPPGGGPPGGPGVRVLTVFYGDGVGTCEGPGALSSLAEILNRDQQQYVPPRFVVRGLLWSKV